FVMTVATGLLCGLAPAWQAGRVPLVSWLKERTGGPGAAGGRLRKALVVGQMAFTLVLLVGAGLFVPTLARLGGQGAGFPTARLLSFGVNPLRAGYSTDDADRAMRRVLAEVQSLPDVERAGLATNNLLIGGSAQNHMTIEADTRIVTDRVVHYNWVSPGFLPTLGIPVIAGRDFDQRDVRPVGETGERAAIVNERFAR